MSKEYVIAGTDCIGRPSVLCGLEPITRAKCDKYGNVKMIPTGQERAIAMPAEAIDTSLYERPLFFQDKELAQETLTKFQAGGVSFDNLRHIHIFSASICACGSVKIDPSGTDPEPYICKKCQQKRKRG